METLITMDVSNSAGSLISVAVIIAVSIGVILICREWSCWYFKINDRQKQNDRIIHNLERLRILMGDKELEERIMKGEKVVKK